MADSSRPFDQRSANGRQLASQFGLLGLCLLILYGLAIVTASMPPRLLDPAWQLRFTQNLISNGFLALLGLALVHLAAYLDPSNSQLIRRRNTFSSLALVAVLGFLLLIPLQGYAVWRAITSTNSQQTNQLREVTGRIAAIREAINRSTSTDDLQRRLQVLRVPTPGPAELAQPLPVLRRTMLETLERTETRASDQLRGLPPAGLWQIIQSSIRGSLSALVLAVGFAAFSRERGRSATLLKSWQGWIQRSRRRANHAWLTLLKRPSRRKADAPLLRFLKENVTRPWSRSSRPKR